MLNTPFSPWPSFTTEEANAVRDVILSNKVNYWTGQECRLFEQEFSVWSESKFAVALGNGTLAIDIALKALGISEGDEVIVTPRTFLASVSSVLTAGAKPVFAEVDLESQNIEAHTIEPIITDKTRAIIVVHLAGRPANMDPIMDLAKKYGLYVIEDCAQAHGAKYKGRPVGSIGDIGAWSFCQDKIMTTGGEGGMVTTNSDVLWSKMWSYKDHGKSYEAVYEREHPPGFRWVHESIGTNWRMTEMQAAIGRIQLKRMDKWHKKRLSYANQIWMAARSLRGLRVPETPDFIEHGAYKCYVFAEPNVLSSGWSRDKIMAEINMLGVPCYSGSCSEVYLEKAFDNLDCRPRQPLQNAKFLGETSLMFLVHPTLTTAEIELTCKVITQVMLKAVK